MNSQNQPDWAAIAKDPKFLELKRKKGRFLIFTMIFAVIFYCLLPIGAAYFPSIFNIKLYGPFNVALCFALSQFIVAWGIAVLYTRKANREFDVLTDQLVKETQQKYNI